MKYIYLDQNKWIELARGINEKKLEYVKLYNNIMRKINEGEWAFLLSSIHINETMKRKDVISRKKLLDLMYLISKGYAICDYMTADTMEFNYWVKNKSVDCSKLRNGIIRKDWATLIGLSSENPIIQFQDSNYSLDKFIEVKKIIRNHCCDREIFDEICNLFCEDIIEDEDYYYSCFVKGRNSFQSWKEEISKLEVYKDKHVYPAYLYRVFMENYKDKILSLNSEMKKNLINIFKANSKNKTTAIANLESLPGFNIHNRLVYELYNNPDKKVHRHDFNDLAYLRIAVPYCDIVIGEKYWCDRINNYKFNEKYNTIVITKLFDLISQ